MLLAMLSFASFAGDLNPPAAPDDPGGAMYSVEDVYDRLDTGAVGATRTAMPRSIQPMVSSLAMPGGRILAGCR